MSSTGVQKKRTFRKYSYRGIELEKLLDLPTEKMISLLPARQRRRFVNRGMTRKEQTYMKKLRAAKKEVQGVVGEKPKMVKTHMRNLPIVPEMIGSVCGVYNGKTYITVEIKPEMTGHYLGEFSITYKPVRHGRPGVGSTNSSRFIPLK